MSSGALILCGGHIYATVLQYWVKFIIFKLHSQTGVSVCKYNNWVSKKIH